LSALEQNIKLIHGIRINMLFLSHLDDDHVVGVDKLLFAARQVDEVVLPYLNDVEWALHLAASVSTGSLSGTFVDLVASPVDWFGARGVRQITFVEGDGDSDDGPDTPDPIAPSGEGKAFADLDRGTIQRKWTRFGPRVENSNANSSRVVEIGNVPQGSVAAIDTSDSQHNWVLSPFAFRPPSRKIALFAAELARRFGSTLTAKEYADAARTEHGRKDLRACYDSVWKTHNLHSMALYSGPCLPTVDPMRCTARYGKFTRRIVSPGWLSTGDFDLSVRARRDKFLNYYRQYASMIGQLMLPHHGSEHSFDPAVLLAFPNLVSAVAAVGQNGHGHPSRNVINAVNATPHVDFVRVDENSSTLFFVHGTV
jgi:hypothetical protein